MGQPMMLKTSYTGNGGRTRRTETSQYPQEKKEISISRVRQRQSERKHLERCAAAGDSPVLEAMLASSGILSKAGHEESCLKPRGPLRKAKHGW